MSKHGFGFQNQGSPPASSAAVLLLTTFFLFFFFFNLTYSRWTSSLPSCLWPQRIFPSLPGSRLTIFYRDASSALLQLVNQWLNFTYSRSHAFHYERKSTNPTLVRIELTTSVLTGVQVTYKTTRATTIIVVILIILIKLLLILLLLLIHFVLLIQQQ